MSVDRILQLKLVTDVGNMSSELDKAGGKVAGLTTQIAGMAKVFVAAFALDEGLKFLGDSLDAAREAEVAWANIAGTMDTLGINTAEAASKLQDAAQGATDLGFSDEEALAQLNEFLVKTGDVDEAVRLLGLSMDIARTKNVDLGSAASDATGIYDGMTRKLREYGLEGVTGSAAVEAAFTKMGTAAETYATTSQGQLDRLNLGWGEFQELVGTHLLGALTAVQSLVLELVPVLQDIWAKVEPGLTALADTVGPRIGDILERLVDIWNRMQPAMQAVYDLFMPIADTIAKNLQPALDAIIGVLDTIIALLNGDFTGAWEAAKGVVSNVIEVVRNTIQGVIDFLSGITEAVMGAAAKVGSAIFDGIMSVVRNLADAIVRPFRDGWNTLIRALNSIEIPGFELPNPAHGTIFDPIGQPSFHMWDAFNPINLPMLAAGGIVNRPTLAMLGEAGPEAVVPLGHGIGNTYNLTVNVAPGSDPWQVGQRIVEAIRAYERRSGRVWRAA